MIAPELAATGSLSTRWFHGFDFGKIEQCGALGSGRACADAPVSASRAARITRRFMPRIPSPQVVDVSGEPFGDFRITELEHVLRVRLAGVGEVEAADEDRVVADGQLR